MRNARMEDANAAGQFSFLCDGTTDTSAKEQMSIVLRFGKTKLFMKFLWNLTNSALLLGKKLLEA